jgi:H+/Cl- antiporter ClcA
MTTSAPTPGPPFAQTKDFWILMGYAVALGVVGGVFGVLFMSVISGGNNWYVSSNDWMGGHWWWVAVTTGAGVAVGLLRMATGLPEKTPGLIPDLEDQSVDPRLIVGTVLVSAASLCGGASLGPEKALGTAGGGAGTWLAQRGGADEEDRQVTTLSGFASTFGGVFSSTVIVVMMIVEIARPGGQKLTKVLVTSIASSSISFGIYFAVLGSVFLDLYPVPAYQFHAWQMLVGVGLGLLAAVVVTVLAVIVAGATRLFDRMKTPSIVKSTIGGLIFGIIGVALPLTMFTGTEQLRVVLEDGSMLGVGMVILLVLAKMLAFGISLGSGFVGGPVFPALFIGGAAGVAVHVAIPSLPLGLTFVCMLAAVPGGVVAAPFSMVLLAGFMTQVGALNTAPALVAVITSFLAVEGVKYFVASRREVAARAAAPAPHPPPS